MKKLRLIIFILVYMIQSFMLSTINIHAEDFKEENIDVLFISSFDHTFISFEDQVKGIMEGFNNKVNMRVEYMDLKVFDTEENEKNFYSLLDHSLEIYDIDVVIAGDDEATEFCIKYRNDLFKDIPISFLGVQDSYRREKALEADLVSGVTEMESIKENIELIKKFHPQVDTITFIDSFAVEDYDEITSLYKEISFEWIVTNDTSVDEVKQMLSKLDKNDALIQLYVRNFKDDNTLSKDELNKIIFENIKDIPVYNVLSYDVGNGSIGGKVIDHFNQGKNAAKIALGLLNNEDKKDLYIEGDRANNYVFDYKYLEKFNIKKRDLPEDSIILNSPKSVFEQYKNIIIGYIMLIVALIIIVITLLCYINSRRKYEKATLEAMHNAEESNKTQTHFISNISHELKTPINVIMSAVQLYKLKSAKDSTFNENINKLDIIDDNCNRLLRLLNNIIDVQKSELNEVKLNLTSTNIVELIENLVMSVVPYGETKNLNFIFDTNEEDIIMEIDVNKIERIVLNLLSNAIKFSKENGEIKVNLIFEEYFYITIEDEGIGIEEGSINNIFNKFTQIDNSLCRKNEGSGIGLSIVKSFVELHNGSIYVESKVNEGTKFTVKLPMNIAKEQECEIVNIDELIANIKMELSDIYM